MFERLKTTACNIGSKLQQAGSAHAKPQQVSTVACLAFATVAGLDWWLDSGKLTFLAAAAGTGYFGHAAIKQMGWDKTPAYQFAAKKVGVATGAAQTLFHHAINSAKGAMAPEQVEHGHGRNLTS